jgi:hypothetical protein
MAFVLPGRLVTAFLGALATLLAVDEEQVVRRVVVGLAIVVLQDQHLHPAEPTGQVPPALGGRLRPQPAGLEHLPILATAHGALPSGSAGTAHSVQISACSCRVSWSRKMRGSVLVIMGVHLGPMTHR